MHIDKHSLLSVGSWLLNIDIAVRKAAFKLPMHRTSLRLTIVLFCTLLNFPGLAVAWFYSPLSAAKQQADNKAPLPTAGDHRQQQRRRASVHMEFLREKRAGGVGSGQLTQLWAEAEAKGSVSSCWKKALDELKSGCRSLRTDDGARSWLALTMATCDDETDGRRRSWPRCESRDKIQDCIYGLDDTHYLVYVQYKLHTDVLCLYIQEESFQERTEAAVHALHTSSMTAAETLGDLHHSNKELLSSMGDATEQQRLNVAETKRLHHQLQDIQKGQTTAFESLKSSAQRITRTVEDASLHLQQLHAAIDEGAARSVAALRNVAQEAEAFQSRTELHVTGMLRGLERLEVFVQLLLDGTVGISEILRGVALMTMVLLLTMPARTSEARLPCLSLAAAAYAVRPLLSTSLRSTVTARSFLTALSFAEISVLAYYALMYRTPEEALRRLFRREVKGALDEMWVLQLEEIHATVDTAFSTAFALIADSEGRHGCLKGTVTPRNVDTEEIDPTDTRKVVRKITSRSRSRRV